MTVPFLKRSGTSTCIAAVKLALDHLQVLRRPHRNVINAECKSTDIRGSCLSSPPASIWEGKASVFTDRRSSSIGGGSDSGWHQICPDPMGGPHQQHPFSRSTFTVLPEAPQDTKARDFVDQSFAWDSLQQHR